MEGDQDSVRMVSGRPCEPDQLAHQVLALRDKVGNLQIALEHSRDIGVAIGVLMASEKVSRDRAFDRLRVVSQHQNRKLYLVAYDVIETGTLPAADQPPG